MLDSEWLCAFDIAEPVLSLTLPAGLKGGDGPGPARCLQGPSSHAGCVYLQPGHTLVNRALYLS